MSNTTIRPAAMMDLLELEAMRRAEQEAVGFLPMSCYERQIVHDPTCILTAWDNGDMTGYLYWTPGLPIAAIQQIVIRHDARREERGALLVHSAIDSMTADLRRYGVTCRCRVDLEAVAFWESLGFCACRIEASGRRGPCIRYYLPLREALLDLGPYLPFRRGVWMHRPGTVARRERGERSMAKLILREEEEMPALLTRVRFRPRIERDKEMVTVFCDALGLAASADSEQEALDKLKQTLVSYSHALQRKNLWEKALRESGIDWQPLSVPADQDEMVVDS